MEGDPTSRLRKLNKHSQMELETNQFSTLRQEGLNKAEAKSRGRRGCFFVEPTEVFGMEAAQESEVEGWVRCFPGLGHWRGTPGWRGAQSVQGRRGGKEPGCKSLGSLNKSNQSHSHFGTKD